MFVFVILKGKIINLWSLFIHDFLVGLFIFQVFQFHSLIFSTDPQIFIIFQQFLYVGILFFDFFDFLYLSILLVLKKKKIMFAQIQALNLSNTFSKIINLGKQIFFFFFLFIGPRCESFRKFFFFFWIGHGLGPNRGMAGGACRYPTGQVWG